MIRICCIIQFLVMAARANKLKEDLHLLGRGLLYALLEGFLEPHETSNANLARLSVNVEGGMVLNLESAGQEMHPGSGTLSLGHENRGFAER